MRTNWSQLGFHGSFTPRGGVSVGPDAGNVVVPDYVETWIGKTLPCALKLSRSTAACSAAISRRTCRRLPVVPDLCEHLRWVPSPVSFVFSSSTGSPLSHSNFRRRVWLPALAAVGLEGVHDLRYTGNQLTADAGANPKELMARMGQDSERARNRRSSGETGR